MKVLIIGGAGYVGARLQKFLIESGFDLRIFDTFWYPSGKNINLDPRKIEYVTGDVRDLNLLKNSLKDIDACIHLACISNDPTFELDPSLAKSINYSAFPGFVDLLNKSDVKRFIYASSSSVYGVKTEPIVSEDLQCEPLTDYSKFKLACEEIVKSNVSKNIVSTILRPSTVCGYSPRQRFDLVVNLLTITALTKKEIIVDGGQQFRPNLHIDDMIRCYREILTSEVEKINNEIFNVAGANLKVIEIAEIVREVVGSECNIKVKEVVDPRSYRVSGAKIAEKISFQPMKSVRDAVEELKNLFEAGKFSNPESEEYYNIRRMKNLI